MDMLDGFAYVCFMGARRLFDDPPSSELPGRREDAGAAAEERLAPNAGTSAVAPIPGMWNPDPEGSDTALARIHDYWPDAQVKREHSMWIARLRGTEVSARTPAQLEAKLDSVR